MFIWTKKRQIILIISSIFFCVSTIFTAKVYAKEKFVWTMFMRYGCNGIEPSEYINLAKYDILDIARCHWLNMEHGWQDLKQYNSNLKIYVYISGPNTSYEPDQDSNPPYYRDTMARVNDPDRHSMGSINSNHSDWKLFDSEGNWINFPAYPRLHMLDFGLSGLADFHVEAIDLDILTQDWIGDGVFMDNLACATNSDHNPHGGPFPVRYPDYQSWNNAMRGYTIGIASRLQQRNQLFAALRSNSGYSECKTDWEILNQELEEAELDIILMEEGGFVNRWGANDVQFYGPSVLRGQLELGQLSNIHAFWSSASKFDSVDDVGLDTDGDFVTFWDAFYFAYACYFLANNPDHPSYFGWHGPGYADTAVDWWFDEYDKINLGKPLEIFQETIINGVPIFYRHFQNGIVYVNASIRDVEITLPEKGVQITHNNLDNQTSGEAKTLFTLPKKRSLFIIYPYRTDVNNNSQTNSTDALLTLRHSLGLSMTDTDWQESSITGDANCDGTTNSTDALLILRYSLGLDMNGTGWCGGGDSEDEVMKLYKII